MSAAVCEITIAYGQQRWRTNTEGPERWSTLMWGWWPDSNGTPSWRWQSVETERVPRDVRKQRPQR